MRSIIPIRSRKLLLPLAMVFAACDQPPLGPAPAGAPSLSATPFANGLSSSDWQATARSLVAANAVGPFISSRVYAAVSVAQYRAAVAAEAGLATQQAPSGRGFGAGGRRLYEAERGALAGASAEVLEFFFPAASAALEAKVASDANASPGGVHPSFTRGVEIGRAIGAAMIVRLQNDGFTLPWTGTLQVGPGMWSGTPVGAHLGAVTPYLVNSTSQFRAAPHPAYGSPAFLADLNEVLTIAQNRTPQQIATVLFWANPAPVNAALGGFYGQLASGYIAEAGLDERAATRVYALMHAAQFDAILTCFESKYHYQLVRPSQENPAITLTIPLPSYPAYPSGHACFSASAARVLEHFFPAHAGDLAAYVEEAGESRIIAGIHYRFDITGSWVLGEAVANWAIAHEADLL